MQTRPRSVHPLDGADGREHVKSAGLLDGEPIVEVPSQGGADSAERSKRPTAGTGTIAPMTDHAAPASALAAVLSVVEVPLLVIALLVVH